MKQDVKKKPIKWGFKYWYRCDSETGYVYQLELYQGRKKKMELNLGLSVVLDLCQNIQQMKKDKGMKRGDYQYNYKACIKWYDNKSVMLLGSHLEEITSISIVQRRLMGSPCILPKRH